MEFQENNVLKSLKRNLETSVDKILSKHTNINESTELPKEQFDNIVDNIMKSKEINTITRKFCEYYEFSEMGKHSLIEHLDKSDLYDEHTLDNLLYQIGQNKSVDNKKVALDAILKYPVSDLVDKYKWPKLSKILRECLLGRNKEIFTASLKIHMKLSGHPQTIIDSTTNILKTLMIIFQSRKIYGHVNGIELRNPIQEQITKLVNLLLINFRNIFKNYNNGREKSAENLINNFMELSIIHTFYDRTDYIHFFYYVFILDPNAKWFHQLMHTITYRRILINFCFKNTAFLKYIIKEFLSVITIEIECCTKKTWKTEIPLDIIKFAALHHCSNILTTLLSYKWGQKLFPIEIKSNDATMSIQSLIMIIITAIQNLSNLMKQKPKRDVLTNTLKTILINNRHFLYNKDITYALSKPFLLKTQDKSRFSEITRKNMHVLQIINNISNTQDGFFIIFGFIVDHQIRKKNKHHQYIRSISLQEPLVISTFIEKYRKQHHCSANEREKVSLGKVIVDFTSNFIRHLVHASETMMHVDEMLYELLECCCNIHSLHSHVIFLINSQKLLGATLKLYKVLIERNLLVNAMNSLLNFFIVICATRSGTDYFLKEDPELLYLLCKHYFFILDDNLSTQGHFLMFFVNLANTIPGCIAITECKKQIITPYLNRIWKLDEDQLLFLSGSDRLVEEEIFKYLRFIFTLQFNFNCVQSLISIETDDESTLIDSDHKPTNLKDLIDETLNSSGPGTLSCFIGLLTVRMLVNNLNILIFLEHAAHLKNELQVLQSECSSFADEQKSPQEESAVIIDECSLLRKNTIDYLKLIGTIKHNHKHKGRHMHSSLATASARNRRLNDFQRFLNDSRNNLHDHSWILQARKFFKQTCGLNFKESLFADLIQQVRSCISNLKNNFIWPENDQNLNDLFPEDFEGISIIIRFGKANKILQLPFQYEDILALLLKQVNSFLNINRDKFEGFDWFVGMIFLICGGNIERSKIVLQCMAQFPVALYIWPAFGNQVGRNKNLDYSIHFDHSLNMLIGDLEIFKPALENASISWNFIVRNWMNQCFFNVLEWNELCNFLVVSLLYPLDNVLFFIICCAQHLESKFLNAITSNDINSYQNLLQLDGLHMTDCFNSMEQLGKQYKNILSRH